MKRRISAILFVFVLAAPFALAQDFQLSDMYVGVNIEFPYFQIPNMVGDNPGATVRTDISLDNPATKSGVMNLVKVRWSADNCENVFKVKFFRRVGDTLTMTAERGPFTSTRFTVFNAGVTTAVLDPPVDVLEGDFIGITRLADCGTVLGMNNGPGATGYGYLQYAGDVQGSVDVNSGQRTSDQIQFVWAGGVDSEWLVSTLPAVGSTKGRFGSDFKTTLQMLNNDNQTMKGRLVFHRAGFPGTPSDPSIPYSLIPGEILTIDDLGAAFGVDGVGSVDITNYRLNYGVPQILAHVYNDSGTGGTTGFYEEPISSGDKGVQGSHIVPRSGRAFMVSPAKPARTRFNIGVRTFSRGAVIRARLIENLGHTIADVTKTYTSNYFEQVDATSFFGVPVGANELVVIDVIDGDIIVYGTATDNVTNDPAAQYAAAAPSTALNQTYGH